MKRLLLVLTLSIAFIANAGGPRDREKFYTKNIVKELQKRGNFNTLIQLVGIAGLGEAITDLRSATLFAPNDDAFAKLPPELVDSLINNPEELAKILLYHVSDKRKTARSIKKSTQVKTLNGKVILVNRQGKGFTLNDSNVVDTFYKIKRRNIIHEIDSVLVPGADTPMNSFSRVDFKVDLERYLGKWYQVGAYKAFFSSGCLGTTAKYSLFSGFIRVKNTCQRADGSKKVARALATVKDQEYNNRLKVSFVPILNVFALFSGDYQIIYLDEDYQYAIVGDKDRNTLFFLSRKNGVDDAKYSELVSIAVGKGFREELIIPTPLFEE